MKLKHLFAGFCSFTFLSVSMAASLSGTNWVSLDEKTEKPRVVIAMHEKNGVVNGTIAKIFSQAGDSGICTKCPAGFKDKPIQGMEFMWGLKQTGAENWEGGHILDPKTGKVYRVKMLLKQDKLYVRGFIGVSVLGRTQVWERYKQSL